MSAPRTNIEKQKRRHMTPLVGVALAVVFGVGMFLLWVFGAFESARTADNFDAEQSEQNAPATDPANTGAGAEAGE